MLRTFDSYQFLLMFVPFSNTCDVVEIFKMRCTCCNSPKSDCLFIAFSSKSIKHLPYIFFCVRSVAEYLSHYRCRMSIKYCVCIIRLRIAWLAIIHFYRPGLGWKCHLIAVSHLTTKWEQNSCLIFNDILRQFPEGNDAYFTHIKWHILLCQTDQKWFTYSTSNDSICRNE